MPRPVNPACWWSLLLNQVSLKHTRTDPPPNRKRIDLDPWLKYPSSTEALIYSELKISVSYAFLKAKLHSVLLIWRKCVFNASCCLTASGLFFLFMFLAWISCTQHCQSFASPSTMYPTWWSGSTPSPHANIWPPTWRSASPSEFPLFIISRFSLNLTCFSGTSDFLPKQRRRKKWWICIALREHIKNILATPIVIQFFMTLA